jgi:hypothetical protein
VLRGGGAAEATATASQCFFWQAGQDSLFHSVLPHPAHLTTHAPLANPPNRPPTFPPARPPTLCVCVQDWGARQLLPLRHLRLLLLPGPQGQPPVRGARHAPELPHMLRVPVRERGPNHRAALRAHHPHPVCAGERPPARQLGSRRRVGVCPAGGRGRAGALAKGQRLALRGRQTEAGCIPGCIPCFCCCSAGLKPGFPRPLPPHNHTPHCLAAAGAGAEPQRRLPHLPHLQEEPG